MSNRWSLGLTCALAFVAGHGCARDPVGEALADRAMSDAVEASVDEPPRESRPAPRPAQPATGGPVEVRVDGLRVERIGARGLVAVSV